MQVDKYIDKVIDTEGGYSNDPNDRGGETMWGITITMARAWGYTSLMKDMPRTTAFAIYKQRYWFLPKLDMIDAVFPSLAEEMLDTGVNMGQTVPIKFLQRALNVLNNQGKSYPDVGTDGMIGPMTIAALKAFLIARGDLGHEVLLNMMNAQQSVRYMEIAEAKATNESFEFGWQANRVSISRSTKSGVINV